jgi:hypothetical protein
MDAARHRANVLEQLTLLVRERLTDYEGACPACSCVPGTKGPEHKLAACPHARKRCLYCFLRDHFVSDCPLKKEWTHPNGPWVDKCCSACTLGVGQGSFHEQGKHGGPKCTSLGRNFIKEYCITLYHTQTERIKKLVRLVDVVDKFAYWDRSRSAPTSAEVREFATWLYAPVAPQSKLSKAVVLLLLDTWSAGLSSELKKATKSLLDTGDIN